MANGAKGAPPTKSEMCSPVKADGGTMQKYSPSPTQKKKDERSKPKIVNLMHPNGTCYGWAFQYFYAAKDELKSLSNRLGMMTVIGGVEFRPLSNLTTKTKWLKDIRSPNIVGQSHSSYLIVFMYMLVTKPRNLHYRYCPLQYWYGLQY